MILGTGITALQVAANPYVTVLGPVATASSRLNLVQAFNSLGTTVGPFFGGLLILAAAPKSADEVGQMSIQALQSYRLHEAASIKVPYLGLAVTLAVLAVVIGASRLPPMAQAKHAVGKAASSDLASSVWRRRHLVLGALGIFTYVGGEVAIGSFLINYISQPGIGNISTRAAAHFVPVYWGGAMVGRFIGSAILQRIKTGTVLAGAAIGAFLLVIISIFTTGHMAMDSILLVGLFNSVMFPSIFALGVAELGPLTGDGSGVLAMAIVGGAVIPLIQGSVADRVGVQHAFLIPATCYLYILYYALKGSKPQKPCSIAPA
jgi:FHS family L-fucose permease-like MFS transporter